MEYIKQIAQKLEALAAERDAKLALAESKRDALAERERDALAERKRDALAERERVTLAERKRDALIECERVVSAGRDVKIAHQPSASPGSPVSAARRPPVRADLLPVIHPMASSRA